MAIDWESIGRTIDRDGVDVLGGTATLYRTTSHGTLNPTTGQIEGRIEQTWTISMVMTGRREFFDAGQVVKAWRMSGVIGAGPVVPQTGDLVIIGTRRFTIGEVRDVTPDGQHTILYEIELVD